MDTPTRLTSRNAAALVLLMVVTVAAYLPFIDDNHRWWGDFSLYMAHAENIATGQPYSKTDFISNPNGPVAYSPPAYPPVYPMLLAPIYKIFGLSLHAPKILNLAIFVTILALFFWFFTVRLSHDATRLCVIAMLAFSPWFWEMKNLILSDVPFILFTLAAIILIDKLSAATREMSAYWLLSILLGLAIYLSYGTRVLGLVLLPTMIVYDLISNRTLRAGPLLAMAVFLVLHQLQGLILALDIDKSYTSAIIDISAEQSGRQSDALLSSALAFTQQAIHNAINNTQLYAKVLLNHWDNGISISLRIATAVITGLLALTGFMHYFRRNITALEIFVFFYAGALLIVPVSQSSRYILPLLPAYLLYFCKGGELLETRLSGKTTPGPRVTLILFCLVLASYTGYYAVAQDRTDHPGVTDPDSTETFEYIRSNTPTDSHIMFFRPRILALFADRKSSIYKLYMRSEAEIWEDFRNSGATHLLLYTGSEVWSFKEQNAPLLAAHDRELDVMFRNNSFTLYSIAYDD